MYGSNAGQPVPSLYTKGLSPLCDVNNLLLVHSANIILLAISLSIVSLQRKCNGGKTLCMRFLVYPRISLGPLRARFDLRGRCKNGEGLG